MSRELLEKLFGREFLEKYEKARARAEQIPAQKLEAIKQFALQNMSNSEDFRLKYDNLDVLLVQAPSKPELLTVHKTNAGNYRVCAIWLGNTSLRGPFISIFCADQDTAQKIVREAEVFSLVVGKLREQTYEGDKTYSMRCQGVIELDEQALSRTVYGKQGSESSANS